MARRDVVGRYKGSAIGLMWAFLNPLLMLVVYTFVFSVVFKAKWGGGDEPKTQFAVILFAGVIVHALFAEVLNRAPALVISNANYVKKVVFPLETLVAVVTGAALFHALISLAVLLCAFFAFNGFIHWTVVFLPVVLLPLLILAMGFAWVLASLGVFARDVGQMVGVLTAVLLFLSPVFFPINALPQEFHAWIMLNPLTFIIEQMRNIVIWGRTPDFYGLLLYAGVSAVFAWAGYVWFQKTRKGFADVL